MPQETRTYRRSELYEEVWAEPVRVVAKRYGVSDVALSKTCRKLAIPLPGVGYWAKKRSGHATRRTPLPPLPEGSAEEMTVSVRLPDEWTQITLSPEMQAVVAEVMSPEAAIVVPDSLTNPHPLVVSTARLLRHSKPIDGVVPCGSNGRLDIAVSHPTLGRALRIFDSLLKALEKRGVRVEIVEMKALLARGYGHLHQYSYRSSATCVHVAGQCLRIDMAERDDGALMLRILDMDYEPGRSTFKDGKRLRIEQCLNDFVAALYVKAEAMNQARAEADREHRRYEEQERLRREAKQRAEDEAHRVKELQELIARRRLAKDIREFTKDVRDMVQAAQCTLRQGGWLDETVTWGTHYADKIDPLTPLAKELAAHLAKRQEASRPQPTGAGSSTHGEPGEPDPTSG